MTRRLLAIAVLAILPPSGMAAPAVLDACVASPSGPSETAGARVTGPRHHEPYTDEAYADELRTGGSREPFGVPAVTGGTIPVHVHVLARSSSSSANVSDEEIADQIDVLNASFAATGWSFSHEDTTRTFKRNYANLAPGRTEKHAKHLLREGDAGELNLYLASLARGLLGWATFPRRYDNRPLDDGVVISRRSLPGNGSRRWPYGKGDTAVHEVGHWMGLFHTFQGGCKGRGDLVGDTSPERTPAFGCPKNRNTCAGHGPDPVENFMDYTDDACMDHFTPGQDDRMDEQFSKYRN